MKLSHVRGFGLRVKYVGPIATSVTRLPVTWDYYWIPGKQESRAWRLRKAQPAVSRQSTAGESEPWIRQKARVS